jgi:hypothetical protein
VLPYSPDYGPAAWVPASSANYTVADRPHDYPVDMIVIHDIEGTADSAIRAFQNPQRAGSAHYVIGSNGSVTQMVLESDIAWHAGNWDYNTRAIGIEHAGFAGVNGSFTSAMYNASEALIASICSRWGVPIDRAHVIGHNQVPDPNNPNLFGGSDHHWDPGPYWHWTNYINLAHAKALKLPSPPVMVLQPLAVGRNQSVDLGWRAGRTCHSSVVDYQIFQEPGHTLITTVPGTQLSYTVTGLQNGSSYTYSVTAQNSDGQSSATSNTTIAMTTPDAPATVAATAAGGAAVVSWTTPANNGGAKITGYVVTSFVGGTAVGAVRFNQLTNPQVLLNLTNGLTYTFTVSAVNAAGVGFPSIQSNAVIPNAGLRQPPAQAPPATPPTRSGSNQSSPAPTPSGR